MARQILPLAGQIIGGMVGGPVGAAIGGAIGGLVGNAIDPQIIKGPKLGDGQVQTSAEGVFRPIVLGTGAVMGNIIHRGPEVVRTHRESQGKGSGPKVETERRYRTFAIRIAEGPIAGVLRIWMDEKLVYDVRQDSEIPAESVQFAEGFRLYMGDEEQLPDPDLEAYLGVGNVNAYRGTAYIVFANFDLTDYGDRIPQFRFEVAGAGVSGLAKVYVTWRDSNNDGLILSSSNGDVFEDIVDTGLGENIASLFSAGNRTYAVGSSGAARSTANGVTWEEVTGLPWNTNGMGYSDGVWIAVAGGGPVLRSTDGLNFVATSSPSRTRNDCAGFGSTFITGGSNRTITFSTDKGTTWGEYTLPLDGDPGNFSIGSIIHTGDHFIAVKGNGYYMSATGLAGSWTRRALPTPATNPGYVFLSNQDYVVRARSGAYEYSTDGGVTFTAGASPANSSQNVASNSQGFYAASASTNSPVAHRTVDTQSWIPSTTEGGTTIIAAVDHFSPATSVARIGLGDVVRWCHERVGADRLDSSALEDEVDGVVFSGEYTAADCIRTLMPVYMFDASEHDAGSGYRINYVKRGVPVVATLTIDDLVDEPEESIREDSLERPKKLHLHFQSPTVGYAPAKATSLRTSPDAKVTGEVSFSVPVVFADEDEAWQRAGVMHQVAWSEVAGTQELVLPDSWLELVPTDNIGLVLRDQQRRLRITKVEHVSGTLKCEMIADRQSSYTSSLTGVPLPKPTPPPPSIVGPSVFAFLDIPALNDNNDRLLYYMAVSGQSPAWHGAVIQRSVDGGANYNDVMTVRQNTIMGELVDPVSDASEHYTDTTNVVRVQLYTDDEIQSLTQQQFLSEGGAFALENPDGTWEVMQYRDAEEDSNGDWLLTTLLRGRLNTETNAHVGGARFVLLDGVYAIDAETSMIGQDLTHRVVSLGTSPETAPTSTDTYTAQSQREWPLAHLISDGIANDEITIRMVPRHRFGTEDHPVRSVNWEGYRIHASIGPAQQTVITQSDTHTFTVPGAASGIAITVGQMNRFTGEGPTTSETYLK